MIFLVIRSPSPFLSQSFWSYGTPYSLIWEMVFDSRFLQIDSEGIVSFIHYMLPKVSQSLLTFIQNPFHFLAKSVVGLSLLTRFVLSWFMLVA